MKLKKRLGERELLSILGARGIAFAHEITCVPLVQLILLKCFSRDKEKYRWYASSNYPQ